MPYNIQGLDLPSIYLASQRARENKQRSKLLGLDIEDRQRQQRQAESLPGAREQAFAGDLTALSRLSPEEAIQVQGAGVKRARGLATAQKTGLEAEVLERDKGIAQTKALGGLARAVVQNPQLMPQMQQRAAAMAQRGIIDPEDAQQFAQIDPANPQQMQQLLQGIQAQGQVFESPNFVPALRKAAAGLGLSPQEAASDPRAQKLIMREIEAGIKGKAKGAGTTINMPGGRQELERAARTQLQKEEYVGQSMLETLNEIESQFDPAMFTLQGRARIAKAVGMDKIGQASESDIDLIERDQGITENLEGIFNQYRKEITGAAAAEKELAKLRKAMINRELSPNQFLPSLGRIRRAIDRAGKLRRKLLGTGLEVDSPEFKKQLDAGLKGALSLGGKKLGKAGAKKRLSDLSPEERERVLQELGVR